MEIQAYCGVTVRKKNRAKIQTNLQREKKRRHKKHKGSLQSRQEQTINDC